LAAGKAGPSFTEFVHRGAKIGMLVTAKPKDRYDLVAFISPLFRIPAQNQISLYKRLLVLSNGYTDVAQFAVDHQSNFVNLTCVRICAHLDFKEFQYTLDSISRIATSLASMIKREFAIS